MAFEFVTVSAGGSEYSTWEEVVVEAGAQHAARSFSIIAAEPHSAMSAEWPFRPGTEVQVQASGSLLVAGYIDTYAPEFGDGYHRAVISGRSKTKDAVDSSAIPPKKDSGVGGEWLKKDLSDIAKDLLKPVGVQVTSKLKDLTKFPVWRLAPGSTIFSELETMARQDMALLIGAADGSLVITRADKFGSHSSALVEGVNIQAASAQLSEIDKHDEVHAWGQSWEGSGKDAQRLESVSRDKTVERHRPQLVIAEGATNKDMVKSRAKWQSLRNAGWSTQVTIVARGWRDGGGALWDPEKLVFVESQRLKISQMMAIKKVRFLQNTEQGTISTMELVDPAALGGKSSGGGNPNWETGTSDSSDDSASDEPPDSGDGGDGGGGGQ
jgi:prophage tail gpP-like protein